MKFLKKFDTRAEYEAYMADNMENYPHVGYIADEGAVEYVKEAPPIQMDKLPLHFEAIEDTTIRITRNSVEYSMDNKNWVGLPANTTTPTISAGSKVYFRANSQPDATSTNGGIGTFYLTGKCNVMGNIHSLLYGEDFAENNSIGYQYAFASLFKNCTRLVDAKNLILPAATLMASCYYYMFNGCTSLVNAPELPAMSLASSCYSNMFNGCTSLVAAPALPATKLAQYCYSNMFKGCTSLVNAPALPATTLNYDTNGCYSNMFNGCSQLSYLKVMSKVVPSTAYMNNWVEGVASTGTFVKNAAATWTDSFGTSAIPTGWTVETATE